MQGSTRELIETRSFSDHYVTQLEHAFQPHKEWAQQSHPHLVWQSGRIHTEYTPFSWYASAVPSADPSAYEVLVIQIECNRKGGAESPEAIFYADVIDAESQTVTELWSVRLISARRQQRELQ